jgi:hypothetical protein
MHDGKYCVRWLSQYTGTAQKTHLLLLVVLNFSTKKKDTYLLLLVVLNFATQKQDTHLLLLVVLNFQILTLPM